MSGNDYLRLAFYHRCIIGTQHAFNIVEVAQFPDRVQVGIRFIKQEQSLVFTGDAHQAQHGEHLQLTF